MSQSSLWAMASVRSHGRSESKRLQIYCVHYERGYDATHKDVSRGTQQVGVNLERSRVNNRIVSIAILYCLFCTHSDMGQWMDEWSHPAYLEQMRRKVAVARLREEPWSARPSACRANGLHPNYLSLDRSKRLRRVIEGMHSIA